MSDKSKSLTKYAIIIILFEVITSLAVMFLPYGRIFICFSAIYLAVIVISFAMFLFAMASNSRGRSPAAVAVFIISNIMLIISLFGKIYSWLGIKDTVKNVDVSCNFWDAVYFSTVTWTTLGYGDIVPTPEARPVAAIEALTGYVVMGLLIAVLLAMVQSKN